MKRPKLYRKRWLKFAGSGLALCCLYAALMARPNILFSQEFKRPHYDLYSDEEINATKAEEIIEHLDTRVRSFERELGLDQAASKPIRIYLCNRKWRKTLLMLPNESAGAFAVEPLNNIYARRCSLERNAMYTSKDRLVQDGRDLVSFLAHESAHISTYRHLGFWSYRRLPEWVREGIAEYASRPLDAHLGRLLARYQNGDPTMDRSKSGRYDQYILLVVYFKERRGMSLDQILKSNLGFETAWNEFSAWARNQTLHPIR